MPTATMLVSTTEGPRPTTTRTIEGTTDLKAILRHLSRGGLVMGFSTGYAVNPTTKSVVRITRKGHLVQRDIRTLVEAGYTEWHYSWAFSSLKWRFGEEDVQASDLDLIRTKDILPWARAFGISL